MERARAGRRCRCGAGQAEVTVAAAGTVTLGLSVPGPAGVGGGNRAGVAGAAVAEAPVTDPDSGGSPGTGAAGLPRYWMHGKGPAPAGNLPVAVHLSGGRIALPGTAGAAHEAVVRLTVACGPEPATGAVGTRRPAGLEATPGGPFRYDLPALAMRMGTWRSAARRARRPGITSSPPGSATSWARSSRT